MLKFKFFILLLLVTVNINAKKTVYTYSQIENNMINIYLVNKNIFDITFKYEAKYKNLISMQTLPIILSQKKSSKLKVASFLINGKKYSLNNKYSWIVGNKNVFHDNNYLYRLPYKLNTSQFITQGFNGYFSHKGNSLYAVDFGLKIGTKIFASRAGTVVNIKTNGNKHGNTKSFAKYANFITIKHNDGTYAKYVHLIKNGVKVKLGQKIIRGEFIGYSGNTGFTNGPHLHFIVFKAKDFKSRTSIPIKFISKNGIVTKPIRGKKYTSIK